MSLSAGRDAALVGEFNEAYDSVGYRYSFDNQGNVTGQTRIAGMGADMAADAGMAAKVDNTFDIA